MVPSSMMPSGMVASGNLPLPTILRGMVPSGSAPRPVASYNLAISGTRSLQYASLKSGSVREHFANGDGWNLHLRRSLLRESEQLHLEALMVLLSSVTISEGDDEWEWTRDKTKIFSVRTCYAMLDEVMNPRREDGVHFPWKRVWEPNIPISVKVTRRLWEELLVVKGETRHAFTSWTSADEIFRNWRVFNSKDLAFHVWAALPYAVVWVLWRVRNEAIFNDGRVEFEHIKMTVMATVWNWMNMSNRALEARQGIKFTDILYGWRMVMREVW
ncbi:hypothetical protein FRX31_017367 [Thalictrum thalictroides]|uniref:Reverse transcriptase zinc-binding domain n=1 Tax=Thalictrum thalictroides TaxID=46969 RepID=A0A7J6W6P4_THATH|nr:hypothetical protein FRX31_017367 [Thalictrum thalictroides]